MGSHSQRLEGMQSANDLVCSGATAAEPSALMREVLRQTRAEYCTQEAVEHSASHAQVEDLGSLKSMRLPAGWTEFKQAEVQRGPAFGYVYQSSDGNLTANLWDRGSSVGAPAITSIEHLTGQARLLSLKDMYDLSQVMQRDLSSPDFTVLRAKSIDVNGKNVVMVDGSYRQSGKHSLALYWLDESDKSSARIQSMAFEGRNEDFLKHRKEITESINSIAWNK